LGEGKTKEALSAFQRALDADPRMLRPLTVSVGLLVSQKKTAEAVSLVEAQVKRAGQSAATSELLSDLYRMQGDKDRARREAERAIELDPNAVEAYMLLARLYEGPDSMRRALVDMDAAVRKRPGYLQGWLVKGALHSLLGQFEEAEKAYRKALELKGDFVPALNELAWILAENGGSVDEALKFAERAVELAPKAGLVNDTLGWIYVKKGVFLKATTHLELAASQLTRNPVVQYHLGKAYEGAGRRVQAVEALGKALKISSRFPGSEDAKATLEKLRAGARAKG
jgi:tetratricopeptide (TPR) repeat protein